MKSGNCYLKKGHTFSLIFAFCVWTLLLHSQADTQLLLRKKQEIAYLCIYRNFKSGLLNAAIVSFWNCIIKGRCLLQKNEKITKRWYECSRHNSLKRFRYTLVKWQRLWMILEIAQFLRLLYEQSSW